MELRVLQNSGDEIVKIASTIGDFDLKIRERENADRCINALRGSNLDYKNLYWVQEDIGYNLKYRRHKDA